MDAILTFLMVLVVCTVIFAGIFVTGWVWFLGLMWAVQFGHIAGFAYLFISCAIIPAIAITSDILEN